jgi:hypothetical protein
MFIKDINPSLTKFSKGAFVSVYPSEWIGFKAAINHSMVEGADSVIKSKGGGERSRKERNLHFKSPITELYVTTEIYPTVFFEKYDGLQGKLRPYGSFGVGLFKFKPQAQYQYTDGTKEWVDLRPLRLEGQGMAEYPDRKEYKQLAIEVPMGIGFKYYLNESKYIGFEVLHRKTFTDYIDDVSTNYIDASNFDKYLSAEDARIARQLYYRENAINPMTRPSLNEQRGNPKLKDSYFSSSIRFGWRLNDYNSPNGRALRQMRCPTYY